MKVLIPACTCFLAIALTGCTQNPPPAPPDTRDADAQAIRDGEAAWVKDWSSKDVDKIASHYSSDAALYVANMPAMNGQSAIKDGLKGMIGDPNLSLVFTNSNVEVAKSSDVAYSRGTYTMTYSDPKTKKKLVEKGKYVTVYNKEPDGTWKAVADINNADAPAAPAS
jgi:ketosteroid isomerase-like protein